MGQQLLLCYCGLSFCVEQGDYDAHVLTVCLFVYLFYLKTIHVFLSYFVTFFLFLFSVFCFSFSPPFSPRFFFSFFHSLFLLSFVLSLILSFFFVPTVHLV